MESGSVEPDGKAKNYLHIIIKGFQLGKRSR